MPGKCSLSRVLPSSLPKSMSTQFGPTPQEGFFSYQLLVAKATSALQANSKADASAKFPPLAPPGKEPVLDGEPAPITLRDAQSIERQTISQATKAEWLRLHTSTLTASNFWRIGHCGTGIDGLLCYMFNGPVLDLVPAILYGRAHEKDAVACHSADKTSSGTSVRIQDCGLVLSTDYRYIRASPDGVVFDKSAKPHFGLQELN